MLKLENAIDTLTCFKENNLISIGELARYIKYICLDNHEYIGDLEVNICFKLGNSCKASYDMSSEIIDLNYIEIINELALNELNKEKKKMPLSYYLKPNKNTSDIVKLYDLSENEIILCNLKIMESLNHEIFHALSFNSILNKANNKEQPFTDAVLHYLSLSSMNQLLDFSLEDNLYSNNHDLFYEEFLAITHSYKWTYDIIDKLLLSKDYIKLYNRETYNRLCNIFQELKKTDYKNYNYTKDGILGSKCYSIIDFTNNYHSFLIPRCMDVLNYPLKRQQKILKNEIKLEKSYLKNLDKVSRHIYALNKLVYNDTSKASFSDKSLLYGNVYVDDLYMFDGTIDNEILYSNMLNIFDNKKAKVKDI